MADAQNEVEVDSKCTKLIIRTRLDMEEEFQAGRTKKSVLWAKVLQKIKKQTNDFNLTKEQICRKFINMLSTYKRIKKRNKDSGRNATTWELFDDFDKIYGTRHSIEHPVANLISSLDQSQLSANGEDTLDPCLSPQSIDDEPQTKRQKRGNRNEKIQYIKDEAEIEQTCHEELMVDDKCTELIVRSRLDMEEEFVAGRKKKSILWAKVLQKIKQQKPDFNLTKEQTYRKFVNMQTTYKRIKNRNKDSGRYATKWLFFKDFDKIYGTRHSIEPSLANQTSSLDQTQESTNGEDTPDQCLSPQSIDDEPQTKRQKRGNQNDILQYLADETVREQKSHEDLMVDDKCTKLIIRVRLDMEEEFVAGRKKKSMLWAKVLQEIKEKKPDFNLTKEQIIRKFVNMQTTYKRIKKRNEDTGRNATTWEFFEDFDEIYGTRPSIEPPVANLISLLDQKQEPSNGEDTPDQCLSPQSIDDEPQPKRKKHGNKNEILQYLEDEAVREQKRHEELMAMEERKLLMQQHRINIMSQLKDVLERAIAHK